MTQMEGDKRPLWLFLHTLTPAEQKYHTTDKELLAVVLAVRKYRVYIYTLYNKEFDLIADHQAVTWLNEINVYDKRGRR